MNNEFIIENLNAFPLCRAPYLHLDALVLFDFRCDTQGHPVDGTLSDPHDVGHGVAQEVRVGLEILVEGGDASGRVLQQN
jgi:hypothetical protein